MGAVKSTLNIIEEADGAINFTVNTSKRTVEVMSNIVQDGKTLTLSKLHIGDPGAGSIGRAGMNELKQAATQFSASRGASQVIVQGAARTTGKLIGKTPTPFIIPTGG